ncbi:flagellin N-terminal-like domain-containing protein [Methanococcoides vulcani]|uniref:Flagellin N-terminal-like domain-containing protein n=1 Tax=Methanococcoides vulcani TaxID=1353158 RepID=A0A1H9Y7M8_9EURY|nr:type IV pilin N-terminal domain-containing protein [Methanococcoides vulcani]SES64933.1 flagellin N-terminal-like domain-containing protein [Methanococcoides vulcani]
MNFKRLFSNEKGVTPVIGVMLMIVVTVILAAAVSSYAGSIKTQELPPQATFAVSADASDNLIFIEALGGDNVYQGNLKIEIASGVPLMSGYANMSNVDFTPNVDYLGAGGVAKLSVEDYNDWSTGDKIGIKFTGDDIKQSVAIGDSFRLTLIDADSGQTIFSTNVVVDP